MSAPPPSSPSESPKGHEGSPPIVVSFVSVRGEITTIDLIVDDSCVDTSKKHYVLTKTIKTLLAERVPGNIPPCLVSLALPTDYADSLDEETIDWLVDEADGVIKAEALQLDFFKNPRLEFLHWCVKGSAGYVDSTLTHWMRSEKGSRDEVAWSYFELDDFEQPGWCFYRRDSGYPDASAALASIYRAYFTFKFNMVTGDFFDNPYATGWQRARADSSVRIFWDVCGEGLMVDVLENAEMEHLLPVLTSLMGEVASYDSWTFLCGLARAMLGAISIESEQLDARKQGFCTIVDSILALYVSKNIGAAPIPVLVFGLAADAQEQFENLMRPLLRIALANQQRVSGSSDL